MHLYLDLLEALPYEKVTLLGFSFGGWLAAEIAAACCHRLERLILVDPLGIKLGDRESRDILDLFNTAPDGSAAAHLARSGEMGARLQRDVGRRDRGARAQSRRAVPLWLAAVHVQPEPAALAVPHRGADAGAVGRERWRGDAGIRPRRTAI